MKERIRKSGAEVVCTFWSPEAVASVYGLDIPRVVYHGDIDYMPSECRYEDYALFHSGEYKPKLFDFLDQGARQELYKKAHIELMKDMDRIANVTACNAVFYASKGHKNSVYVGNTWIDPHPSLPQKASDIEHDEPYIIIGHVGYLNRTGSMYGLDFLQHVIPYLKEEMGDKKFEVHIIGGGDPPPVLHALFELPNVVRRGFVEDLDAEVRDCDLFCLFNNAGRYSASYTRHVVAWSMGSCLVVHENSKQAISEIVLGEGVLSAASPKEAGAVMAKALKDPELNLSVRKKGRALYEEHFTPEIAVKKLEKELQAALS
jgi:glycosyltransferase involved in cell wall biosynthesis